MTARHSSGRTSALPYVMNTAGVLTGVTFFVTALLSAAQLVIFAIPGYFPHEFARYNVYEDLPVSAQDADRVMSETMAYLRGSRERLDDVTVQIDGIGETAFYNAGELSHMADVKSLFAMGFRTRRIAAVVCLICICAGVAAGFSLQPSHSDARGGDARAIRRSDMHHENACMAHGSFYKAFSVTMLVMLAACAAIVIYASSDFTGFFTRFHMIFFPQGNWEFDPASSRMINMLPEGIFSDTAMYIAMTFVAIEAAALILASVAAGGCRRRRA